VGVDVDRGRRGGRDVGINVRGRGYGGRTYGYGQSYGYSPGAGCQEILRRYKQCIGH
jgi:hypothetical protein